MSNTDGPGDIDPQDAADETEVRIRRAPKYSAFLIVGGGLGAVITFILTALFPVDPQVGFGALFGYFALYGVTGGVLLGALLALVLDRVTARRARPATAVTTLSDPDEAAADAAAQAAEDAEYAAEEAAEAAAEARAAEAAQAQTAEAAQAQAVPPAQPAASADPGDSTTDDLGDGPTGGLGTPRA
jgi:predicted lipid-binding transport protein (Tim44 family)